ncbi:MAG TPA: hypothetical protein VMT24_18110 [Aggregatilineaceae bacterium]|nr:hypothetical protein [Aggregatilineaceae bacterium]
MMWYSLYLPTASAGPVIDALRSLLAAHRYAPYDPFPGGTGTPGGLTDLVRQFVAPPQGDWLRILGQPAEALLPEFSTAVSIPVLYAWLTDDVGGFALFQDGARHDDPAMFQPYLRESRTPDDLRRAWAGQLPVGALDAELSAAVPGEDALPPEIQQFAQAQGVDARKAGKLFERLGDSLFSKLGRQSGGADDDEQAQARAIFMGGGRGHWNSLNGQRVRAIASVLDLPSNWRLPTWETVRDAYHVHRLRQRRPRMALMPGDKEAMDAVPDALDYTPIYMGK